MVSLARASFGNRPAQGSSSIKDPEGLHLRMPRLEDTDARTPAYLPSTISRYRVSLVYDHDTPYADAHRITDPSVAAEYVHTLLHGAVQETMGSVLLDTRNRAIGHHIAYRGALNRIAVEPRGLLVPALLANAAGFMAFHNHPSGDSTPSVEDIAFTRRLDQAADIVGLRFIDHIVVGQPPTYTSLRNSGYIQP